MDSSGILAPREVSGSQLCQCVDSFHPWCSYTRCQLVSEYNNLMQFLKVVKAADVRMFHHPASSVTPSFSHDSSKLVKSYIDLDGQVHKNLDQFKTYCDLVRGKLFSMTSLIWCFTILNQSPLDCKLCRGSLDQECIKTTSGRGPSVLIAKIQTLALKSK